MAFYDPPADTSSGWLLDALSDGVLLVDGEWRVLFANVAAERLLHRRRQDVVGRVIGRDLPEPAAERMEVYREVMETRESRVMGEVRLEEPELQGRTFAAEVHPSPGGGIAIVFRDVTEQRRSQEQLEAQAMELEALNQELRERTHELEEALATRNRFYAAMSHELRTPINAIIGYNDLILAEIYGPLDAKQQHGIERSQKAAHHLREIVDDVLDISRLEAGKVHVQTEPVDVHRLLEDLAVTAEPLARSHDAPIHLSLDRCQASIVTDPRHVRQILLNLVSNAARFGRGHPVEIRCRGTGSRGLEVEVVDQGKGIPAGEQERIFEEFVQLREGDTGEGTGLGLPISRRLAERLGGRLEVESEPGRGSTFRLVLPENG